MKTFVLASNNKKKIAELRDILGKELPGVEIISLSDAGINGEIVEDGVTFEENSVIKASVPAKYGYIGIADDSGLCVNALGGAPGVHSARYSGKGDKENNKKLLCELSEHDDRTASFVCVMSVVFPDGKKLIARGETEGVILTEYRGENGFGYDPLFYSPALGKTFAEATQEEKSKVSHRGRAIKKLCEQLKNELRDN